MPNDGSKAEIPHGTAKDRGRSKQITQCLYYATKNGLIPVESLMSRRVNIQVQGERCRCSFVDVAVKAPGPRGTHRFSMPNSSMQTACVMGVYAFFFAAFLLYPWPRRRSPSWSVEWASYQGNTGNTPLVPLNSYVEEAIAPLGP